jgi:hypothetical protein
MCETAISTPDSITTLQSLVEGLSWISESDHPFEVSRLPEQTEVPTAGTMMQLMGKDATCPVTEISVRDFFAPAIAPQDWYEEAELETMQRFQTLLQWLEENLTQVTVYRLGEIEIDVCIVGRVDRDWINLSTRLVET